MKKTDDGPEVKRPRGRPTKYVGNLTQLVYARVTAEQERDFLQLALDCGYTTTSDAVRDLVLGALRRKKIP